MIRLPQLQLRPPGTLKEPSFFWGGGQEGASLLVPSHGAHSTKKEMQCALGALPACFTFPVLIQESTWKKDSGNDWKCSTSKETTSGNLIVSARPVG